MDHQLDKHLVPSKLSKVKIIFFLFCLRHFERWTKKGDVFDVEELDATLSGYVYYPESFLVFFLLNHAVSITQL